MCRSIKPLRMLHKRALSDSVLELLPEEGQVLDLTCGEGLDASEVLTKTNCKVFGVDWDPSRMPSTTDRFTLLYHTNTIVHVLSASKVGLVEIDLTAVSAAPVKLVPC